MADSNRAGLDGLVTPPLSRRGFVMTSLISGLTAATTRAEAQAIHTDATGIEAGEVKIPAADGPMPAYRAVPDGAGPFPIVLVIEEIFGVHEYIKDICRRLAKAGYCAVAPELYARQGDLSTMTDPKIIIGTSSRRRRTRSGSAISTPPRLGPPPLPRAMPVDSA